MKKLNSIVFFFLLISTSLSYSETLLSDLPSKLQNDIASLLPYELIKVIDFANFTPSEEAKFDEAFNELLLLLNIDTTEKLAEFQHWFYIEKNNEIRFKEPIAIYEKFVKDSHSVSPTNPKPNPDNLIYAPSKIEEVMQGINPENSNYYNCYAYGCNLFINSGDDIGELPLGYLSDTTISSADLLEVPLVLEVALRDGLSLVPRENSHPVYFVVAPGEDYHWYRQGRDGLWTHKLGYNGLLDDLDSQDGEIFNPIRANHDYKKAYGEGFYDYSNKGIFLWVPDNLGRNNPILSQFYDRNFNTPNPLSLDCEE